MKSSVTPFTATCLTSLTLLIAPGHAADEWKPAAPVKSEAISGMLGELKTKEPGLFRQPTLLAYKTAVFLASGSTDSPPLGTSQKIEAKNSGGEETFTQSIVTVEFTGYADDSLTGERFTFHLSASEEGVWKITKITRAALGRGDQK